VEAPDAAQLGGVGLGHQQAEQPARLYRSQLAVIAHQHHLGSGPLGQGHHPGQIGAGHHGCLVDHHHLASAQPPLR
jgi:Spy/CpxP family protein refolding chaperone